MTALDERRRRFVIFFVHAAYSQTEACRAAGYKGSEGYVRVQANRLMRERPVLNAMREEAERHLDAVSIRAIRGLGKLVEHKNAAVRLRAIDSALDRRGFARRTEQMVAVEHRGGGRSYDELLSAVAERLRAHNLVALPAPIEGEFQDVTPIVSREMVSQTDDGSGDSASPAPSEDLGG